MYKIVSFSLMMLMVLCLADCAKDANDFDHKKWNYIYTGDYSNALLKEFNDTINTKDQYYQKSLVLDINHDNKPDMEIISYYSWYLGQTQFNERAIIKTFENCEIIADTTVKSIQQTSYIVYADTARTEITYVDSILIAPKALDANYRINRDDHWYHGMDPLNFSFSHDIFRKPEPNVWVFVNNTYTGWGELNDKYLGFRILSAKDTLYGFIKMNVREFKWINLENSAYR